MTGGRTDEEEEGREDETEDERAREVGVVHDVGFDGAERVQDREGLLEDVVKVDPELCVPTPPHQRSVSSLVSQPLSRTPSSAPRRRRTFEQWCFPLDAGPRRERVPPVLNDNRAARHAARSASALCVGADGADDVTAGVRLEGGTTGVEA